MFSQPGGLWARCQTRLVDSDCFSCCFVTRSPRIVLGIHGSDFPGSEIGCFEPGNVFLGFATLPQPSITAMRIKPNCSSTQGYKERIKASRQFHELSQFWNRISRRWNISFLMSLISVNWPHRVTSQFLGWPSTSMINSSTSPSLSGYFSRRCCLQMSAVCFWRFLVPSPIGDSSGSASSPRIKCSKRPLSTI